MKEIGHTYSIDNEVIDDRFINWYVNLCNHTDTLKNKISMISQALKGGVMKKEFILRDEEIARLESQI